jgi:hypothetical protein
MICTPCKMAGRTLRRVPANAEAKDKIKRLVVQQHGYCQGGTWCDCAHKLEGVNWNLVDANGVPRADPRRGA